MKTTWPLLSILGLLAMSIIQQFQIWNLEERTRPASPIVQKGLENGWDELFRSVQNNTEAIKGLSQLAKMQGDDIQTITRILEKKSLAMQREQE